VFAEKPAEVQYTVPSCGELLLVDFFSVLTYLYPSLFQGHFLAINCLRATRPCHLQVSVKSQEEEFAFVLL